MPKHIHYTADIVLSVNLPDDEEPPGWSEMEAAIWRALSFKVTVREELDLPRGQITLKVDVTSP